MRPIPVGAKGTYTLRVAPSHLANQFKDAALPPVFATPMMVTAMENAALNAVRNYLDPGESATDKLKEDVKNFLAANGVPAGEISVDVKDHENPEDDFDIDDPENDLKLFDVTISVDWSAVSLTPVSAGSDHSLTATVVFRNGRATISN